jgi:hypothetical protein
MKPAFAFVELLPKCVSEFHRRIFAPARAALNNRENSEGCEPAT